MDHSNLITVHFCSRQLHGLRVREENSAASLRHLQVEPMSLDALARQRSSLGPRAHVDPQNHAWVILVTSFGRCGKPALRLLNVLAHHILISCDHTTHHLCAGTTG